MTARPLDTPADWTDGQGVTSASWAEKLDGQKLDFVAEEEAIRQTAMRQSQAALGILNNLENEPGVRTSGHAAEAIKKMKLRYSNFLADYVPAHMMAIGASRVFSAESLAEKMKEVAFRATDAENEILQQFGVKQKWEDAVAANIAAFDEALKTVAGKTQMPRVALAS